MGRCPKRRTSPGKTNCSIHKIGRKLKKMPNVTSALNLSVVTCILTPIPLSWDHSGGGDADDFKEQESTAFESGWLDPVTQTTLQVFTVFFIIVLLALVAISLYLRRRLKDKIKGLEKTRRQLEEQNDILQLVTENTTEGIWDFHVDEGRGSLSRKWYPMFGYKPIDREVPLSEWDQYVHPDDLPASREAFSDFIAAGCEDQFETEMRIRQADGTWRWVLSRGRIVTRDSRGKPLRIIGLHLDIQRSKENQKKIEQSKEDFRKLFKYAPVPMAILTEDGKVVDVNDRTTAVLGYVADDIESLEHWWRLAHPDPAYRKDVAATQRAAVEKAIASGSSVAPHQLRVTCKDGTERIGIIEATIIGKNFLISFFDMTDHVRAEQERERLREQLLQAQKLEAVGTLAGGVAHDFNNMIAAIMGYSELILDSMEAEDPHRCYQERILDATHRSADLTRQLLTFARKQTVAPVTLDLNQAVDSMLKLLRRLIGENIELTWLPGKASCKVTIDPSQLDQILANLCVNARDAISDVGRITIETKTVTVDRTYCATRPDFKPGEFVLLVVSDNGVGMDAETVTRIFDPFFTTKKPGEGTGMGLATVYGIMKQNDGFINVYSEKGQGTTFRLYFPLQKERKVEKRTLADDTIPPSKGETLLVIEDDVTLLKMIQTMLQKLGYTVLTAETPGNAMRTAKDFEGNIHLLITDVIMPEMNGRDMVNLLRGIRPGVRSLFMSGYTANIIKSQGVLDEGAHFVQKPFSEKELAIKVRGALD
jgi:two-component system, cell cycle sensor histidine kinase and response regulator CckA